MFECVNLKVISVKIFQTKKKPFKI